MTCPACGYENREGARFCGSCASLLVTEVRCSACGTENPAGQKFCDACAQPLSAARAPSARPAPSSYTPKHLADRILDSRAAIEGERKPVTVLFADIVDSVSLSERSDPEEMHSLMDRCFQAILPEIHRYEGTINQFQGDGFMALFGAPIALEDAPRRACLAALAIQSAVEPLRQEVKARHGVDLQWRIGIHSGPVVVGRIGDDLRMDYTAVGDTTNLAARLEKAAPAGGILISETTRRLVAGLFETEDQGSIELKGKSRPTHVHRILSERRISRIEAGVHDGLTPLCGRQHELDALEAAFDAAREGRGQVVSVVGEAGIGKSRLLHEFQRHRANEPHTLFLGLCVSYGRATFQPIVDGLRRLCGIEDRDDENTALERVAQTVAVLGASLEWTLPFLRDLLSLPVGDPVVEEMDGVTRRSETVKALNAFFLGAASDQPLIFGIEDLHWIDPASEEFLAGLVDSAAAAKVLILLTYRPGYEQPFGDRSYHRRIAMQALSETEMTEMARALLDGAALPDELRRRIAAKAEGNPLFIEEVTKSLREDGVLQVRDGQVVAHEAGEIPIPDRIHDVLMARIDRLEDGPKQAIQMAAVIGREFALRLLEKLVAWRDGMDGVVEELRALELIYEKATHPELAFMFKHALTHDVAYQSVLVKRRKMLHGIVGSAIEEVYADRLTEHYEKLAHHYELAESWEKAFEYHALSARKAARTYANRSAAEHCRSALRIAERIESPVPAERLQGLEEMLGSCCLALSEFRASGEALERAAEHATSAAARARNLARAGYAFGWGHDYARAREITVSALELARASGSPGAEALATCSEDNLGLASGAIFDSSLADEAVRLAELADDPEALVIALSAAAGRLERAGDFRSAVAYCERVIHLAHRDHLLGPTAALAQWYLGISQCCLGRYGAALETIREALEMCERIGDHAVKPRLLNTLGWCYAEFNCHERAIEFNRRSTELAREMVERQLVEGAPELYANGSINLAGNRLALGDLDGAARALAPIEDQMQNDDDYWMRWRYSLHLMNTQARLALVRGDLDRSLELTRLELEGAQRSGSRKIEARALELRGRVLVAADLRDEAEAVLSEAARIANQIGYRPVQWRVPSLRAEIARRRDDTAGARHHATRTRQLAAESAASIPDPDLRRNLAVLGEALAYSPLTAYR